jgi:hypothetical protein
MSDSDPTIVSRGHSLRLATPLVPPMGDDGAGTNTAAATAAPSGRVVDLTSESIDEQIRRFFASDRP